MSMNHEIIDVAVKFWSGGGKKTKMEFFNKRDLWLFLGQFSEDTPLRYITIQFRSVGNTKKKGKYSEYLKSDHWKTFGKLFRSQTIPICFVCDETRKWGPTLHIHHLSYENKGRESLVVGVDVVPCCSDCHHEIYKAKVHGKKIRTFTMELRKKKQRLNPEIKKIETDPLWYRKLSSEVKSSNFIENNDHSFVLDSTNNQDLLPVMTDNLYFNIVKNKSSKK